MQFSKNVIPIRIYGIDFSGAKNAGKWIWIAKGIIENGTLLIEDCTRGRDLPGSGTSLEECLPALKDLIKKAKDAVFGLDFPFSLPKDLVEQGSWKDFALKFPSLYSSAEELQKKCTSRALKVTSGRRKELNRKTDKEAKTPFSPYNRRIFKQTYYGIREILTPLVRNTQACVLPMQKSTSGKPWIIEICPASTLKTHNLYQKYKYRNRRDDRPETRSQILKEIVRIGPLRFQNNVIRESIIDDRCGDALDSVIAAMAIFRALKNNVTPPKELKDFWNIEGFVYV